MIGDHYWTTGIELTHTPGRKGGKTAHPEPNEWGAQVSFYDDGFCDSDSTEGTLTTRYCLSTITEAIDLILVDMERLGIRFTSSAAGIALYAELQEGYDAPEGWKNMVRSEAERRGWTACIED